MTRSGQTYGKAACLVVVLCKQGLALPKNISAVEKLEIYAHSWLYKIVHYGPLVNNLQLRWLLERDGNIRRQCPFDKIETGSCAGQTPNTKHGARNTARKEREKPKGLLHGQHSSQACPAPGRKVERRRNIETRRLETWGGALYI